MKQEAVEDRYQLESVVISGGATTIRRARLKTTGRVVGIERPLDASDEHASRRDLDAMLRATKRFHHPNILAPREIARDDHGVWSVVDWPGGETLDAAVRSGRRCRGSELLPLASGIASALVHAARHAVPHGAVFPANLVRAADGVKLIGFGHVPPRLAAATRGGGAPSSSSRRFDLAMRQDVFDLCRTLWQIATGDGGEALPDEVRGRGLPPWLEAVLERGLSSDPEARFADAEELLRDLQAAEREVRRESGVDDDDTDERDSSEVGSPEASLPTIGTPPPPAPPKRVESPLVGAARGSKPEPEAEVPERRPPAESPKRPQAADPPIRPQAADPSDASDDGPDAFPWRPIDEQYELLGDPMRGGMGTVHRARERATGRLVALKRMHPHALEDRESLRRFRREAQNVARLNHSHILQLLQVGRDASGNYLVLEWAPGGSLADRVGGGEPLPEDEVLSIARKIGTALVYAHAKGCVHRDIKPHNILVAESGEPKLADFGLARTVGDATMTASGATGSPHFMAPEQFTEAHTADERSDLFSFAKTIYNLVTGCKPHTIDPSRLPRSMRDPILRCLRDRPEDRYPNVQAFLAALDRESGRRTRLIAAGVAAAILVVAIGAFFLGGDDSAGTDPKEPTRVVSGDGGAAPPERGPEPRETPSAGDADPSKGSAGDPTSAPTKEPTTTTSPPAEPEPEPPPAVPADTVEDRARRFAERSDLTEALWRELLALGPENGEEVVAETRLERARSLLADTTVPDPVVRAEFDGAERSLRETIDQLRNAANDRALREQVAAARIAARDARERCADARDAAGDAGAVARDGAAAGDGAIADAEGFAASSQHERAVERFAEAAGEYDRAREAIAAELERRAQERARIAREGAAAVVARWEALDAEYGYGADAAIEEALAAIRTAIADPSPAGGDAARVEALGRSLDEAVAARERTRLAERVAVMAEAAVADPVLAQRDIARLESLGPTPEEELALKRAKANLGGAAIWIDTARAIEQEYGLLDVVPQRGLVPLRKDPNSGLFEFWVEGTGKRPAWTGNGKYQYDEDQGVVLVLIPPGRVTLGARTSHDERALPFADNEGFASEILPLYEVELEPYFLAKDELTQAQWHAMTGRPSPNTYREGFYGKSIRGGNPVESIKLDEALEVLAPFGLTLPTEAQWEHGARGGSPESRWTYVREPEQAFDRTASIASLAGRENVRDASTRLHFPNDPVIQSLSTWIVTSEVGEGWSDEHPYHWRVGIVGANPFGLNDVLGNLSELCIDRFCPARGVTGRRPGTGEVIDGALDPTRAVRRGGNFAQDALSARVNFRGPIGRDQASPIVGVRPARSFER